MMRSLTMPYAFFEKFASKPEYEYIVVGTGALARDMQKKLCLLGLKTPFLIGDQSLPDQNIRHYNEIAALDDPQRHCFIICCDFDELDLIEPAMIAVHRLFNFIGWNDSRLIDVMNHTIIDTYSGKRITDAMNGDVILSGDKPYAVYGDENDDQAFSIHIVGSCTVGGIYNLTQQMPSKIIWDILAQVGFRCTLYSWAFPSSPPGNSLINLIRGVAYHKCDLLIYSFGLDTINTLRIADKNVLATCAGTATARPHIVHMCERFGINASNGADHFVDVITMRKALQKVFIAYAQHYGFTFWEVLQPNKSILPISKALAFGRADEARIARAQKNKEALIGALDKRYTKDYSDILSHVEDIFAMYHDGLHLSNEGNRVFAERLAAEILAEFKK